MFSALKKVNPFAAVKSALPNPLAAAKSAIANPAEALKVAANPAAAAAAAAEKAKKAATDAAGAAALKSAGMTDKQIKAAAGLGGASAIMSTGTTFFTQIKTGAIAAGTWFWNNKLITLLILFVIAEIICIFVFGFEIFSKLWTLIKESTEKTFGSKNTAPPSSNGGSTAPPVAVTKAASVANQLAPAAAAATTKPIGKEGFEDAAPITLQNAQPLTIKQAAYLGPVSEGHFDTDSGAVQALRAGFRSFIFQIDYLDTKRDENLFAPPGIPTLLYRGDDAGLISENSADINAVAQSIANSAFRPEVPKNTDPVIIYLHILRAPSLTRDPDGYKLFLSKIAKALNPLAPMHLGMTPLGTFHRQKQEAVLLATPLSNFEGQVIVLCNADTSVFKNADPPINPADDLDFWVNMRVYLNDAADSLGVTQMPAAGVTPSAVVVRLDSTLALPSQQMDAFASQGKGRFVIALPSQMSNPTVQDLDTAINVLGINMVPLDIFSDNIDNVKALVKEYDSNDFRLKPVGLRQVSNV